MSSLKRQALTTTELEEILNNLENSEDEFEDFFDSASIVDPNYIPEEENLPNPEGNVEEGEQEENQENPNDVPSTSTAKRSKTVKESAMKSKIPPVSWNNKHLQIYEDSKIYRKY